MRMYGSAAVLSAPSSGILPINPQAHADWRPIPVFHRLGSDQRYLEQNMGTCLPNQIETTGKAVSLVAALNRLRI